MYRQSLFLWLICCGYCLQLIVCVPDLKAASEASEPNVDLMRQALHHALDLQFDQAIKLADDLKTEASESILASQLIRGMIAYFQTLWQTAQSPAAHEMGHKTLSTLLEKQQDSLETSRHTPWPQLLLGTAAIFDALLQQTAAPFQSLQRFGQGQDWLQQVLMDHETAVDAHLGLGLTYFAADASASPILRLLPFSSGKDASQAVRHLRRAADRGRFSQDVAKTFLAQVYEREKWYEEAIALGQELQGRFPHNGFYRLLSGRSQCAQGRYQACAETLQPLATQLATTPSQLVQRDDRFDLYYHLGTALNELGRYDQAFTALRQAINQDPRAAKDETLWAKYHVARLYERRGQLKTARQMYQTLLRGRNVEALHQTVERRLTALPDG